MKKKITPNLVEQIPNYFYDSFWNYECSINIIKSAFKHKIFLKKNIVQPKKKSFLNIFHITRINTKKSK